MSLRFSTILQVLTTQWMSREEIERRVGGPCTSQFTRLRGEGQILHMVDATRNPWVHKYCLSHDVSGLVIPGPARRRCVACPFMEAAPSVAPSLLVDIDAEALG
jgi:hypothetical protein